MSKMGPEPTLADHGATMAMLLEKAGDDPAAQKEVIEWGERRERRLPVMRRFAALLHRNGIIDGSMSRVHRDFMITQCFALATRHGLDMMGYTWRDSQSGPLSAPMRIDLHAVEPEDGGDGGGLFPGEAEERAFLEEVAGKGDLELGRMARPVVIPERERIILLSYATRHSGTDRTVEPQTDKFTKDNAYSRNMVALRDTLKYASRCVGRRSGY